MPVTVPLVAALNLTPRVTPCVSGCAGTAGTPALFHRLSDMVWMTGGDVLGAKWIRASLSKVSPPR